jgi:hypothetical protein
LVFLPHFLRRKPDRSVERELDKPSAERIFMFRSSLTLCAMLLLAILTSGQCPITRPPDPPFVPPAAYAFSKPNPSFFSYGTDTLWTELQLDGKWGAFGKEGDGWVYETKLTYWHRGFDWRKDKPNLTVTGKRLDGDAPTVTAADANAVFLPSKDAAGRMTLLAILTLGCWEITAHYEGHDLSFVVSVEPGPKPMTTEELELYGDFLDSFLGAHGQLPRASLLESVVPLILKGGNEDECSLGIGFKISEAANQRAHQFPASIAEGRPLYLVDPNGVGPEDRQAGVLSLSEIGFDDDHRFAVFTWELLQSGLTAVFFRQGGTVVFQKIDGTWSRTQRACTGWIT